MPSGLATWERFGKRKRKEEVEEEEEVEKDVSECVEEIVNTDEKVRCNVLLNTTLISAASCNLPRVSLSLSLSLFLSFSLSFSLSLCCPSSAASLRLFILNDRSFLTNLKEHNVLLHVTQLERGEFDAKRVVGCFAKVS